MCFKYGSIVDVRTYQKTCKPEHFMKKYQGFGISVSELDVMETNNVKFIWIIYQGKDTKLYFSHINQWKNSKKSHVFEENDVQKFVPCSEMYEVML